MVGTPIQTGPSEVNLEMIAEFWWSNVYSARSTMPPDEYSVEE